MKRLSSSSSQCSHQVPMYNLHECKESCKDVRKLSCYNCTQFTYQTKEYSTSKLCDRSLINDLSRAENIANNNYSLLRCNFALQKPTEKCKSDCEQSCDYWMHDSSVMSSPLLPGRFHIFEKNKETKAQKNRHNMW